jgi:excisionase family DNA binding protein
MQRAFNPGQIGRMLGVSTSLVQRWIDEGKLPGYKIPFTRRRKVLAEDLQAFCKEHDMGHLFEPLRPLGKQIKRRTVLLCGMDPSIISQLTPHLGELRVDAMIVPNRFELIAIACNRKVIGVAVDFAIGKGHAIEAGLAMAAHQREMQRVGLVYAEGFDKEDAVHDAFNVLLCYPFRAHKLAELLTLSRRDQYS